MRIERPKVDDALDLAPIRANTFASTRRSSSIDPGATSKLPSSRLSKHGALSYDDRRFAARGQSVAKCVAGPAVIREDHPGARPRCGHASRHRRRLHVRSAGDPDYLPAIALPTLDVRKHDRIGQSDFAEQRHPTLAGQQWMRPAQFGIGEPPPSFGETEDQVDPSRGARSLDEHPADRPMRAGPQRGPASGGGPR